MPVPHHSQDPWTKVKTLHDFQADEVISALQKEIRRGNTENATLLACEMLLTSAELEACLWSRLQVISVEDVGYGNLQAPILVDTLYRMHQRIARPSHDRYMYAVHAVRVMSQSPKERGSDDLKSWAIQSLEEGILPEIPEYALDMHTQRGQQMGRDLLHFLTEASKVMPEIPDRDTTYLERLIEKAKQDS